MMERIDPNDYVTDPCGALWSNYDIRISAERAVDYFTSYEFQSQFIPAWDDSDPRGN